MRALRILGAAILLSVLPIGAYAQTSASSPDESSLVAQITALEQEIQALTSGSPAASAASTPANPVTTNNACPTLQENLSLGESGPDVSSLQVFLAGEGMFSGTATGYFGTITQAAVEQWQASNNIVTYGTPSTTGFGAVGPRTRLAIESSCGSGATPQNSCLPAQPPTSNCSTGWQPVAGANGCTAYYQCAVPIPGAATTTTAATSTSTSQSCPIVPQPICNGTVAPYQTNSNGCVTSYECVI